MIPDYPYYGFPNYVNYINKKSNLNSRYIQNSTNNYKNDYKKTITPNYRNNEVFSPPPIFNQKIKPPEATISEPTSQPMFSILGLDLYFDDILILVLILFLFNEGSTDYFLIMILFLLLMN